MEIQMRVMISIYKGLFIKIICMHLINLLPPGHKFYGAQTIKCVFVINKGALLCNHNPNEN